MRIAYLSGYGTIPEENRRHLAGHDLRLVADKPSLMRALPEADVLVMSNGGLPFRFVDGEALDTGTALRLIQLRGVTWDALDLDAATRRGIPVANVPGGNSISVAELALFLMFAVAKRARLIERTWRERKLGGPQGVDLCGKRLCIVGFGRIGLTVAVRARSLGMDVVVVNRSPNRAMARAAGASAAYGIEELETALRGSHFVLLSLPLNESTIGLMDARMLAAMPRGSYLINVSRGPVVARQALEAALDAGHLAGYGTDVWWQEPAPPDDPLLQRDDVFHTPHMGAATAETRELASRMAAENVARVERGLPPLHVVNGILRRHPL